MKTRLRISALTLLLCSLGSTARAEGSRQLTPNTTGTTADLTQTTNTRAGYLIHDSNSPAIVSKGFLKPSTWSSGTTGFSPDYRLFIRVKQGETLLYGIHRTPTGTTTATNSTQQNLILTLRYGAGAGTIVKSTKLYRDSTSAGSINQSLLLPNQAGVIASAAQNQAGPYSASNTSGYAPLTYTNTTGSDQDFYIEFTQQNEAGLNTDALRSYYDFWDFTVRNSAGTEIPGRLYSKFWAFSTGNSGGTDNFQNRLSASFNMYSLVASQQYTGQYYAKQIELAGMRPLDFYFVSNANGSTTSVGSTFEARRKSQITETGYAEYPNFVNNPDPSIWPSAPTPTVKVTPQLFCQGGETKIAFTTTAAEAGQFDILIDLNGTSGYQAGSSDRLIQQTVAAGTTSTIIWDGVNGLNQRVNPSGQVLTFNFTSSGAPINFPVYDAEGNPDGFRVRNSRPTLSSTYDLLYWDDTNLTNFSSRTAQLVGASSATGTHSWGNGNNEGDTYTVNTWTYGFSAFQGATSFIYTSACDNDADGITDNTDIDDDNDGIPDETESFSTATSLIDPSSFRTTESPILYLDVAYTHPVLGAFRDSNNDGINDIFDVDLDGIPNHFDLDADGDGLPDAFEANGNSNPTYTRGNGANQSRYSTTESRYIGNVGSNGLPNAVENRTNGNTEVSTVRYTLADTDGDTFTAGSQTVRNYNFLDVDSDNDGIMDEVEALTTTSYATRSAQANFNTDTNKNGLRDAYDPSNSGTAIDAPVNTDAGLLGITGDNIPDMLDFDSDNDNVATRPLQQQTADWTEGFDTNQDGVAGGELLAKARLFATNNPGKAAYYRIVGPASGVSTSPFLQDDDKDNIPNFLDSNSAYYHDDNFNGLVDLFDPTFGGSPSSAPKAAGATEAAFRTNGTQVPLPVELLRFQARPAGPDALLTWATATEKNSARFEVERSTDAVTFVLAGSVEGQGTVSHRSDYSFTDKNVGKTAGTRYYRLRQIDQDGTATLSSVQVVTFDGKSGGAAVTLYPSPTHNHATLDLLALPAKQYTVEIIAADGRRVARFETAGGREIVLPVAEYAKGTYLVRVSGQGHQYLVKLLKN